MKNGVWEDEQILSQQWVEAAVTSSPAFPGYGNQIWLPGKTSDTLPADLFMFRGVDTQLVYVVPSQDLIVVRNDMYYKHDGPPVGEPFLFFVYPPSGMGDMKGTIGPESWSDEMFLGRILESIQ